MYLIALSSRIRIGIGLVYMVSFKELHYIFERNHLFNYTFLWLLNKSSLYGFGLHADRSKMVILLFLIHCLL